MSLKQKIALFLFIIVFCSGWLIFFYQKFSLSSVDEYWRDKQYEQLKKIQTEFLSSSEFVMPEVDAPAEANKILFGSYFKKETVAATKEAITQFLKQNDLDIEQKDIEVLGALSSLNLELPLQDRKELIEAMKKDPLITDLQSKDGVWQATLSNSLYENEAVTWLKNYPGVKLLSEFAQSGSAASLVYGDKAQADISTLKSLYPEILK